MFVVGLCKRTLSFCDTLQAPTVYYIGGDDLSEDTMVRRKLFVTVFMLLLAAGSVFAEGISISFGPAYTNYFIRSKVDGESSIGSIKGVLGDAFGKNKDEVINAAGFAVDIRGKLFYAMLQMAFPSKTHSDLLKGGSSALKNSALIFDSQLGIGMTLFKDSPFNLFLGAGIGFNTMYSNQKVKIPSYGEVSYAKTDFMLGVGVNVLASFYFTKIIGIYGGLADTVYMAPIKAQRKFTVAGKDYTLDSASGNVKNSIANSFNLKLGLSIRF